MAVHRLGADVGSLVASVGVLVSTGMFGLIADQVSERRTRPLDDRVLAEAVEHRGGPLTELFAAVSVGAEIPLAAAVVAVATVLTVRGRSWAPLLLAGSSWAAAVAATTTLVKIGIARARPEPWWQLLPESG